LAFGTAFGKGERVARSLVAGLADVDLVQPRELLLVVGDRFDHDMLLGVDAGARQLPG
jgi:hypothetical protein